ncbi:MAG: hydroxymethylbilane synthase [Coxiellaceae bacterium]|nr:hydroxymethylbilane synthase [Coxiellaceae bacterium]
MATVLRIATRKSKLALWQANFVKNAIEKEYPACKVQLIKIMTEGDRQQTIPLTHIGGKSVFVKALQKTLLNNEADIAVHSMKDMSVHQAKGLVIAAVLERADPRDAFLSCKYSTIEALPQGAIVGTASPRRTCLVKSMRPDIEIKLLRGNVDTRLAKLARADYDAIILAAAGLDRLDLFSQIRVRLSDEIFTPAIAQGAIAVECREEDDFSRDILQFLNDEKTAACVSAERAVNEIMGGDCHTAIGAYAKIMDNHLFLNAMIGSEKGETILRASVEGNACDAKIIGEQAAKMLLDQGAKQFL